MPLNPFNIGPMVAVVIGVLLAVIILAIRAGDEWWNLQSTDLTSSDTKSTTDIEELVWAAFWILLFLGLLMGLLNQRHMAANAVLEVPLGRPPVFAFAWAGACFTFAVLAAVFSWPLFGKHPHLPTYLRAYTPTFTHPNIASGVEYRLPTRD